jgi:K+ transporter
VKEGTVSACDAEAGWKKKNGKSHVGYKAHVAVDEGSETIGTAILTSADLHDTAGGALLLGRGRFVPSVRSLLSGWREKLFISSARNSANAAEFFCIPTNRLVELGGQVPI